MILKKSLLKIFKTLTYNHITPLFNLKIRDFNFSYTFKKITLNSHFLSDIIEKTLAIKNY